MDRFIYENERKFITRRKKNNNDDGQGVWLFDYEHILLSLWTEYILIYEMRNKMKKINKKKFEKSQRSSSLMINNNEKINSREKTMMATKKKKKKIRTVVNTHTTRVHMIDDDHWHHTHTYTGRDMNSSLGIVRYK